MEERGSLGILGFLGGGGPVSAGGGSISMLSSYGTMIKQAAIYDMLEI